MRSAPLLLVIIATAILPACRSGTDGVVSTAADDVLRRPSATVTGAYVTATGPEAASVDIVLALKNPQAVELPVRFGDLRLRTDAGATPTIETRPQVTMPPGGVATVTLQGVARHDGQGLVGQPLNVNGSLTYEPPGELRQILTDTGVPLPTIGFANTVTAEAAPSETP
ncbi:MAG: hypothetical protein AAGI68_14020 [Planctomycetota bacterium]